jgi:hypothetical protein
MEWTNISYNIITDFNEEKIVLEKSDNIYKLIELKTEEDSDIFIDLKKITNLNTTLLYFTDIKFDIENKKKS